MRNKNWFIERIGKKIYRSYNNCNCPLCTRIFKEGIEIISAEHAERIYITQNEMKMKYYDTKKERDEPY